MERFACGMRPRVRETLVLPAGSILAWPGSDGTNLASFGAGLVKLWNATTGEQAFTFWELQHHPGLVGPAACTS